MEEPKIKEVERASNKFGQSRGFGISLLKEEPAAGENPGTVVPMINPMMVDPQPQLIYYQQPVMPGQRILPYIPRFNSFSSLVTVEHPDQVDTTPFNPSSIVPAREPKTVGFPKVDNLKEATVSTKPEDAPAASVSFSNLVVQKQNPNTEMFGVSPLPENAERSMLPKVMSLADTIAANAHLNKDPYNQSGKKLNNWFTRLLDQRGQDYISSGKITTEDITKNAERIFDDMISGRIDYIKQGNELINPIVIETLINYCSNKLAINKAIQFSLGYVYNDYSNKQYFIDDPERYMALNTINDSLARNIAQSISIVNQDIGIYQILFDRLNYVNVTKNASSLFSLTNDLNNYRKAIKKRY